MVSLALAFARDRLCIGWDVRIHLVEFPLLLLFFWLEYPEEQMELNVWNSICVRTLWTSVNNKLLCDMSRNL